MGRNLATKGYVKTKTQQECGTANHKGTRNVRITFAKTFTRRPKIICSKGEATNVSVTGFTHTLDIAESSSIDYIAIPQDENGG